MSTDRPVEHTPHRWRAVAVSLVAGLCLAGFVLVLYYPLLFTNRVLASGDILLYFYPYRDYASAMLRAGQIPLWNPYVFLGAPFLANPQAAVLYPLHWPLIELPVTGQVYWSAALHTWLLGFGGYLLMRGWGLRWGAALTTGLVLSGSGFYGGLIGHLNQMNGAAWLPFGFWILDFGYGIRDTGYGISETTLLARTKTQTVNSKIASFALVVALMVLAGHTQTAYINLFGLGLWTVWPGVVRWWAARWPLSLAGLRLSGADVGPRLLVYSLGTLIGVLICAAQLLPTVELSALGLRGSGLSYTEATSFSLKPLHLLWTLLPSYGLADLGAVFATPGYTEYVAYVGSVGLLLAALGAWQGGGAPRVFGLLFALVGLVLAFGRWNPLYFALYSLVPGFDLFRNPARWMMLYTLGMAVLAGVGVDWVIGRLRDWRLESRDWAAQSPNLRISSLHSLVLLVLAADLLLAARALPHTQTTAPQAIQDLRTAPAHLLADPARTALHPAAMGRFLGMSTITYDPGDMADWARILRGGEQPQLDQRTFDDLIIALKVQELLVPNLSLLWRLPAVDGFDGGLLPLQRYNEFLSLFVPREELVPDGRLREQLRTMPSARLLNLLHGQYIITDKVRDLWFENVFYDRQIGATLHPDGLNQITMTAARPFAATHLGIIGYVEGDNAARSALADMALDIATVRVQSVDATAWLTITAGGGAGAHWANGGLDSPLAVSSGATVAYRDVDGGQQEYLARLTLPQPMTPLTVTVARLESPFLVAVQGVTLIDATTGMFAPLLPSDRGHFQLVHSGDVKIYENVDVLPRAYLAHQVRGVDHMADALTWLQSAHLNAEQAVVEGQAGFTTQPAPGDGATITTYAPERIEIRTRSQEAALLVLSDTFYPGWVATVDGVVTPIYPTNVLLRGVPVPPGEHTIVFTYRPASWRRGLWISGIGLILCFGLSVWAWRTK